MDDKKKEARKKASMKYNASHTKQFKMTLNIKTDADVIAKLEAIENKQGYIKDIIRKDIQKDHP